MTFSLTKEYTFDRYLYLSRQIKKLSICRALQYEWLSTYPIKGTALDFGGGEKCSYRKIIQCSSYQSVNIDPKIEPTWIIGIGDPLPCENASFDTVLSLNTLEHIFDTQFVLAQFFRVLKPEGELLLSVPFLYPIHAHPDDFFRPTPSWFQAMLSQIGFRKIEIASLYWGPYTTAMLAGGGLPGPFRKTRQQIALLKDFLYKKIRDKVKNSVPPVTAPVALFVRAVK